MPLPWRLAPNRLIHALRESLNRLGLSQVDLYQVHFPMPPLTVETWAEALADAVEAGLTRAVGVSNYNVGQTMRTHATLMKRGIPLASNQVEYSLLNRKPETSGLVEVCRDLGVTIIAYSPIAKGMLTGKYTPDNVPPGMRSRLYNREYLGKIQPLIELLKEIGQAHDGLTREDALTSVAELADLQRRAAHPRREESATGAGELRGVGLAVKRRRTAGVGEN